MANISEIVQEQSYRGDPNLSGYGAPILLDTRPLDELARYTMIKNKFMYDEEEKKKQGIAKQIADLAAYDLTVIPEESKIVQDEWGKLVDMARKDPTVMDFDKNPQGYINYYEAKNRFANRLNGGKGRQVVYAARQAEIEKTTDLREKARLKRELDADVKATGIDIPLPATHKYDIEPTKVTAVPMMEFDVTKKAGNFVDSRSYALPNMASVATQANALELGLTKDAATPKTPQEQSQYDARIASKRLEPIETSKEISEAIAQLPKDENGNIDFSKAPAVLKGVIEQANNYNEMVGAMRKDILEGQYEDQLGPITFGKNRGLNESDYALININDGVSANELLRMRILAASPLPSYKTKVDQTNEALNNAKLAQDEAQSKRQYNLELEKIAASKAAKGKTTQEILSEMGNALDSFTNYGSAKGSKNEFRVDNNTGQWIGKDGKPYTSPKEGTRIAPQNVPDKIKNLIKQANPDYDFSGEGATLIIQDGEVKSIQYDKGNPVDRNNIQNYQVNEVSKFTEKGNPFIPFYGAGEANVSRPAPITTTTETKESSSQTNRLARKTSINRSDIPAKAAAAGYTVSEYEELLKSKGVEIK